MVTSSPSGLVVYSVEPPRVQVVSLLLTLYSYPIGLPAVSNVLLVSLALPSRFYFSLTIGVTFHYPYDSSSNVYFELSKFLLGAYDTSVGGPNINKLAHSFEVGETSTGRS